LSGRSSALVDGAWLESRLADDRLIVLEVDERPLVYRLGHVPGAHSLDWRADLQDPVTRDIPGRDAIARLFRRVGLRPDATVVLYGDNSNWYACFAYWLLRSYGIRDLRLLDGGRQVWLVEGRPLTTDRPPENTDGKIATPRHDSSLRADWQDIVESASGSSPQLLDVRTPAEYRGDVLTEPGYASEGAQRPGHIPGALSVPWEVAVDNDGRILSEERLRERLAGLGVDLTKPAITYCRIGERSAHTWFVLNELLGIAARNYDGSWAEWGSMIGMPVALGDEPLGGTPTQHNGGSALLGRAVPGRPLG
jgi:thiosulfate/3-mercaptopyruvate sulfurtransferase